MIKRAKKFMVDSFKNFYFGVCVTTSLIALMFVAFGIFVICTTEEWFFNVKEFFYKLFRFN